MLYLCLACGCLPYNVVTPILQSHCRTIITINDELWKVGLISGVCDYLVKTWLTHEESLRFVLYKIHSSKKLLGTNVWSGNNNSSSMKDLICLRVLSSHHNWVITKLFSFEYFWFHEVTHEPRLLRVGLHLTFIPLRKLYDQLLPRKFIIIIPSIICTRTRINTYEWVGHCTEVDLVCHRL